MNSQIKQVMVYFLYGSSLYFIISVVIAIILNPDYRFFDQFLSILGTGSKGWIFNIPVMVLAIATGPYYYLFYQSIVNQINSTFSFIIGCVVGILSSILLFFIGFFPVEGNTADIHNILALSYFFLIMLQFAILSYFYHEKISELSEGSQLYRVFFRLRWFGLVISILVLIGLVGPSFLSYTLQKVIVGCTLYYLIETSFLIDT